MTDEHDPADRWANDPERIRRAGRSAIAATGGYVPSEVDRLRAALQRIANSAEECGCRHDDENCCEVVRDVFCARCIAAVALRQASTREADVGLPFGLAD